ncbi:hypothetical protein, partial [Bifidobacterium adolescentis]|uniref:hypothetical protein n=1 Tax=Bifidobacterium adolescentis TaxID=1680 RepID=UPI001CAA3768
NGRPAATSTCPGSMTTSWKRTDHRSMDGHDPKCATFRALPLVDLCVSISEKIDDKARLHSWISRKNVFIENEKCDIDTESKC